MTWPTPRPGLVIRYSYLWSQEAEAGREEGLKDRPCAVVISVRRGERDLVYVVPVTHSPPASPDDAVELPAATKARLGLDSERSWIVVTEANSFTWPGPDLRFVGDGGPETSSYGMLPPALYQTVRARFAAHVRAGRANVTRRTE